LTQLTRVSETTTIELTGERSDHDRIALDKWDAFAGDPALIYRAICHDPLTASVLSLREIKDMVNELFAQHKDYLPQFKVHQV
jgi:alpha-galactosidase/6-phospho-beta-glucosidase family protein